MDHNHYTILCEAIIPDDMSTLDTEENVVHAAVKEGDELLIDLIKSYPHLYNKGDKNYKDTVMKDNSWTEIAAVMKTSVTVCQNRWLRLRERWTRENKIIEANSHTGEEGKVISAWPLYDHMKFLKQYIFTRKRFTNVKYVVTRKKSTMCFENQPNQIEKHSLAIIPDDMSTLETEDVVHTAVKDGDELLIDLIKNYPHLYNKGDKNYKDTIMKDNSWTEIAAVMKTSVTVCQNRWLRLREKWTRENKIIQASSRTGEEVISVWPLYDHMKFLKQYIFTRKRFTKIKYVVNSKKSKMCFENQPNQIEKHSLGVDNNSSPVTSNSMKFSASNSSETIHTSSPDLEVTPAASCSSGWKHLRKKEDSLDVSFRELATAVKQHLTKNNSSSASLDADELFCRFVTAELQKKPDEIKNQLKQEITTLLFSK